MSDESGRLERIEIKVDKLTTVIADIVRVEERIAAGNDRINRLEHRMDIYEDDIGDLKEAVQAYTSSVKTGERLFWIVITALVGAIVFFGKT